jgi:acetoin utilization protein AcuB
MFVSEWMTTKVYTVTPDDNIATAVRMLKDHKIRHLPVVRGDVVVGLVSDRDIKDFQPSKATTLDIYELHYLLDTTPINDIMKKDVITIAPDAPIEEAAMIMHEKTLGCLPVVEKNSLVGIISDKDIFRVLVDITGVHHKGVRFSFLLEDRPGSIKDAADIIRSYGFRLLGVLSSYEGVKEGYRKVVIRVMEKADADFDTLKQNLMTKYPDVKIKRYQ